MEYLVAAIFCVGVMFLTGESLSGLARQSGYIVNAPSIGIALQNQILSLNRFTGFTLGPLLGLLVDFGIEPTTIVNLAVITMLAGALLCTIIFLSREPIINKLAKIVASIRENGYSLRALGMPMTILHWQKRLRLHDIDKKLFFSQLFTSALVVPSIYAVNALAAIHVDYKATLVQLGVLLSGLGNLFLNFYTFPKLAVLESNDRATFSHESIFLGKIIGILLAAPLLIIFIRIAT